MKQAFLTGLISTCLVITVYAQKPVIDSSVFDKWPRVGRADISSDGNYMVYDDIMATHNGEHVMVLQDVRQKWNIPFKGIRSYHMLHDGKHVVLQGRGDSLFILEMATQRMLYLACASDYQLIGKKDKEWLWYAANADSQGLSKLMLYSIKSKKKLIEDSVTDQWFGELGNVVVVKKKRIRGVHLSFTLEWHNLDNGVISKIWEGDESLKYNMDRAGKQLVFITKLPDTDKYRLWYYHEGMASAELRIVDENASIGSDFRLDNSILAFSRDGQRIFFSLVEKNVIAPSPDGVQVDLWSYRDPVLREAQQGQASGTRRSLGWMSVATEEVHQLEKDGMRLFDFYNVDNRISKVLLVKGDGDDVWWRGKERAIVGLSSFSDKDSCLEHNNDLIKTWTNSDRFILSPQDNFVLYHDPVSGDVCSYEIAGGQTHNITKGLQTVAGPIGKENFLIAGWLPEEKGVLLYDNWDIWRLDPRGVEGPANLTKEYGRLHHIRLRFTDEDMLNGVRNGILDISPNKQLLLAAFDTVTKYSGYYRLRFDRAESPALLTMGPYRYFFARQAANADAWLVLRESAEESPNYYYTRDWIHWIAVTEVAPEKHYNWLKAELVTWPLPNGQLCQGMLFKPEDLAVHKKYPLLVHYYQAPSDELYQYREPKATMDGINIPYFVSRGYVVFVPDIHYRFGYAGESALASVVSGVRYLTKLPWIDSARMGLQGHSFGGYETNYIVTHTNLFAAAEEGSGVSDMISDCNGLGPGGLSNQDIFEVGQYRMRASLWERPDLYIKGSPIFNADKVTTPLLMMANKKDVHVPWLQGVEFFSALRRCGKKVWMLQYDHGEHFVQPGVDALDYTTRIEQFFDHYLKGVPPPKWMTEGIPAEKKGLETGYELDTSGKIP